MLSICLRICISILLSLFCIATVVKSDTVSGNNPLTLGLYYMEMEQYDKALTAFEDIRIQEPSSGIYCYIGMVYQEQNRLSDAVEAYKKALNFQAPPPIHGSAHLHLGIVYKEQGKITLSQTHLTKSISLNPKTPQAYIHLGEAYLLTRQFDKAATAYRKSIQLNPNFTESYYGLGRVAEMQHDYSSALEHYRLAIKQNPYDPQSHYRLAIAYRNLKMHEDSKAAMSQFEVMKKYSDNVHQFRETIYKHQNEPILYLKLGELHEQHDNIADALRVYEIANKLHPIYLPIYQRLGNLFVDQRDLGKAIATFQKITEIDPKNVQAWLKLGVIYINRQQFEPAIVAFRRAIEVDETSAEAYNNLARLYAGLGRETGQAVTLAQKAVALSPSPKHYDTLAYTYYRNQQYIEALDMINRAITLTPNNTEYINLRSKIEEEIKDNKATK